MASQTQENLGINLSESFDYNVKVVDLIKNCHSNNKIEVRTAKLINITGNDGNFISETTDGLIHSKKIILATGITDNPRPSSFKTQKLNRYISNVLHNNKNILVVGGGDSALLTILRYYKKNKISWVFRSSLEQMKYNIFRLWKKELEEILPHINIYPKQNIQEISCNKCFFTDGTTIQFDIGFLLIGYEPDFSLLRNIGIELSGNLVPNHNLKTFESNVKGIYLCGIMMKETLINNIMKTPYLFDSEFISGVIYKDISERI